MRKVFLSLGRKEQSLLVALLCVILMTSLVLLNSYLRFQKATSEQSYLTAKQTLLEVQQAITLKSKINTIEPANVGNLNSAVSSLARSLNLTIDRIQPTGSGEIMVSVNQTSFTTLYEWIKQLEGSKGITVNKASIRKNSTSDNRSEVRAQLVLKVP